MKRTLALLIFSSLPAAAQVPRAEPVDPALRVDAANDYFKRGERLLDEAKKSPDLETRRAHYQRASEIFADYINEFPEHPNAESAWWYLGNAYYQSGRVDDGKRCFSTLINRYREGKWVALAAYILAADHYNKREYAFAAPMFEKFAANAGNPTDKPKGNYYAGLCYRMLNRDREAATAFSKVAEDPAGGLYAAQANIALGSISAKNGKLEDALARYEAVVKGTYAMKYRSEAALQAALAATRLDQHELAESYLKMILTTEGMEDFRPDAQLALMENHFAKKEFQQVIEIFRRSGLQAKGEKEAVRLMIAGRAYVELKQYVEAVNLFRDVEKLASPDSDLAFHASYYRLICFFQIEGRHIVDQVDAFLQIYGKSRADDDRIHTALLMKAESLFAEDKTGAAAAVYSQIDVSKISEANRPGMLYHRGWCLAEAGDSQGAIRSLSEFISKYPEDSRVPSALAKRAKAFVEIAEPAKAIADFDRLTGDGIPQNLVSFAWLESARMRRSEGNMEDMILRYRGLLQNIKSLPPKVEAEANFRIGWGMVKTNAAKEAVPFLEKARDLHPATYGKHAGLLLTLGYFASQDPQRLAAELNLAIEGQYASELPDQTLHWAGMQLFNGGDYQSAARFLSLVANPKEPRETPKEVWRYLGKARLEIGDPEGALEAVNHLLEVEDNPAWKADGLLDRGRALLALDRATEARAATDEALELRPQGRTSSGLRILHGDLKLLEKDTGEAAAAYLYVVQFQDGDLKANALHKLIGVLELQEKPAEAEKYRQQLQEEFPDWKPPGE